MPSGLYTSVTQLAVLGGTLAALWHGSIDGATFIAVVSAVFGVNVGAAVHAAGVKSGGSGGTP